MRKYANNTGDCGLACLRYHSGRREQPMAKTGRTYGYRLFPQTDGGEERV